MGMRRVTVLVAEDHPLMIEAIKMVLAESEDFEVVGVAESGMEVAGLVEQVQPDLVLLDLDLPELHGLDVVRSLTASKSPAQVVSFSAHEEPELIDAALRGSKRMAARPGRRMVPPTRRGNRSPQGQSSAREAGRPA